MRFLFLFIFIIAPKNLYAFHEASYGLQSLTYANNTVMGSPPLPMLYMKGGDSQFTIQYSPFSGSIDGTDSGFRTQGSFQGGGGAFSWNRAWSDTWGYYLLGVYNTLSGDFSYTSQTCTPFCTTTEMRDVQAQASSFNLGLNWTMLGGGENDLVTLGLLFGGSVAQTAMAQRVRNTDSSNVVTDDFKMKTNPVVPSAILGLQLGLKFGGFVVNPYFIGVTSFADSDCYDYTITETTVAGSLGGQSSPTCAAGGVQNKILLKSGFSSLGLRLHYQPWGLSVNAVTLGTAPSESDLKSLKINSFTVALSF